MQFAAFLEKCDDIISYVKNYMAVHFKIDYVNAKGDISNYYPDFIVKKSAKEVFIVETKDRIFDAIVSRSTTASELLQVSGIRGCHS